MNRPAPPACIGIFDSGVGGLSVLRALRQRLPAVPLHYIADSAHAPYGELPPQRIAERSRRLTEHLLAQGARLLVVACNTATAVTIDGLREQFPTLPFVGVEPGLKPAVAASRNRRIAVLATPATVASERMRSLVERHAQDTQVRLIACAGLADLVEDGLADRAALQALLAAIAQSVREAGADTVVLGCTHYPFVADELAQALGPGVQLIDTAQAVAEQAARLWEAAMPISSSTPAPLHLHTTGDGRTLQRMAHQWLGESVSVAPLDGPP